MLARRYRLRGHPCTVLAAISLAMVAHNTGGHPIPEAQPPATAASTPEAVSSQTPVLDAYRALAIRRQSLDMMALGFVDESPRLSVQPNAGADLTPERLDAAILEAGPIILELIELSPQTIEPLPESIDDDPALEPYSRLPNSWFRIFSQLLHTDAKRCWRDGDAKGAMTRLAAASRISSQLAAHPDAITRATGSASLEATLALLVAMVDDGLDVNADRAAFDEIRGHARAVDPKDPCGYVRHFEHEANARVAAARAASGSPPAAARLAEYIATNGVDHAAMRERYADIERHGHLVGDMGRLMLQLMPDSAVAGAIATMSDTEIAAAFDAAEALIAPTAAAMRRDDMEAVHAIGAGVQGDPTQLRRLVVGSAELELVTTRTVRARWLVMMERLNAVE